MHCVSAIDNTVKYYCKNSVRVSITLYAVDNFSANQDTR